MQPFIGYWGYLSSQPIGLQDDPDTAIEQGHKAIAKAKQANFGEGATVCSVTCWDIVAKVYNTASIHKGHTKMQVCNMYIFVGMHVHMIQLLV